MWPVAARQIEILTAYVGADALFAAPRNTWVFVDWNAELDRTAAMHGIFVYALRQIAALAGKVGESSVRYADLAQRMTAAARSTFLDPSRNVFISGPKRQVSWATQAWIETMEAAFTATNLGIQLLGGHGFIVDHLAEKRFREARMLTMLAGAQIGRAHV